VEIGGAALPGVRDCPIVGGNPPLVVISHGRGGSFFGQHDIAETLADAGFVFAAMNHPGDTSADMSRSDDLAAVVERPTDIKRLIDFMLQASLVATKIDPQRGYFGFSRGGYTGLVQFGANPDWAVVGEFCYHVVQNSAHFAFLTPCPPAVAKVRPEPRTDAPGLDRVVFHHEFDAAVLAFLRGHLPSADKP
jgi:predicted dienelactone hydrolase